MLANQIIAEQEIDQKSLRKGVNQLVLDRIREVSPFLALIFIAYDSLENYLLPATISRAGSVAAAISALIYIAIWRLTISRKIPFQYAHPVLAFMTALALLPSFITMALLHDSHRGAELLLTTFACSVVFASRFWFGSIALTVVAGWTAFLWLFLPPVPMYYSFALYSGVLLSVVVQEYTRSTTVRLLRMKMESQQQAADTKQALQEAYQADALFRAVIEGTSDAVFVKDQEGRYLMVNPAYLRDFGRPREMLLGRTASEVYGEADGQQIAINEREVMESGKSRTVEETLRAIQKTYLSNVSPYINREGEITGIVGISRNITERKQAEKRLAELVSQLKAAKKQAEQATEAKSNFLTHMSHEIRTPMNGVLGMSELLLETPLDPEQREYASTIRDSAEALLEVINDILDLSKIEAGKMPIEQVPFNLAEQIRNTTGFIQPSARSKNLAFESHIDAEVAPVIVSDPIRLRQILLNLLSNAVKFTDKGQIVLRATMHSRSESNALLQISVEDSGIGVPADKLEHIFERFAQVDGSTTRKYGGTGLGLSISRQLAELMGGDISVRSQPGIGSTFLVEIPVGIAANDEHVEERQTSAKNASDGSPADISRLNVLLVEDNFINQKVALQMLGKIGVTADLAGDGIEAVEMARRKPYDVILMDCEMPRMNGFEATAQILQQSPPDTAPAVFALTANAMVGYEEQCLAAGMQGYLTKPLDRKALHESLGKVARGNGQNGRFRPKQNVINER